jgi:RNA polymerase sigma factor (sigma-70 family)
VTYDEIEREYRKSYKDLVNFAYLILNDEEKAKEVVQEVFTRLLTYRGRVRIRTFHTWMLKRITLYIKAHVWENDQHKVKDEHRIVPIETLLETKEEGFTLDEENEPLVKAVAYAMSKLKEKERTVVSMVVFQQMTHAEVAQDLGVDEKTVLNRYKSGIQKLRLALASVGIEAPSSFYNTANAKDETAA